MSYGHSHGNANLPTVLAGGVGLGLKHGKHIDYNLPVIKAYNLADAAATTTSATGRWTARRASATCSSRCCRRWTSSPSRSSTAWARSRS